MSKIRIGDVVEIKTQKGLAYALYTHRHKMYGELLRVWNRVHSERPSNLAKILTEPVSFSCFFPLGHAVNRGAVKIAGRLTVPAEHAAFPNFRSGMIQRDTQKVFVWWLWDGEREWKVATLTPEQLKYPLRQVVSYEMLVYRIEIGWTPESDPIYGVAESLWNSRDVDPAAEQKTASPAKLGLFSGDESHSLVVEVQLNARLQPVHRGELFEDPLDDKLQRASLGEVSGGGSMLAENGEIAYCNLEIAVSAPGPDNLSKIVEILEYLGAPKGSVLKIGGENRVVPFGVSEGLAVYLNGTDLPKEVYQQCDVNFVYSELNRLVAGEGRVMSYWQGQKETALYLYGRSYEQMNDRIAAFVSTYPLLRKSQIKRIA